MLSRLCFSQEKLDQVIPKVPSNLMFSDDSGHGIKGNSTALHFFAPGALWLDVSSAPALLLGLQHLPCFQAGLPSPAMPVPSVLLLLACRGQHRGHFVALPLRVHGLAGHRAHT